MTKIKYIWLLSIVLLNLLPPAPIVASAASPQFVQVQGHKLVLNGQPILLKGMNFYSRLTPWNYMWSQWDGPQVQQEIAQASLLGSNVLRVLVPYGESFGWNDDLTGTIKPDYLNELKQFVQLAGNNQMRVIITLFDFYGGYPVAGTAEEAANYNYLQTIATTFKDDDRVLAWDLHNEPDNYDLWKKLNKPDAVIDWLARIGTRLRQLDTNHLITIGAGSYENLWYNDAQGRSISSLSDFIGLHSYNALDLGNEVYHIREHMSTIKPILLEETGWPTGPVNADPNFNDNEQYKVYNLATQAVTAHSMVGYLGWTMYDFIPIGPINLEDYQNYYGLSRRNGTLKSAAVIFKQGLAVPPLPSLKSTNFPLTAQPVNEAPRTIYFPQTDHYVSTPLKELWRRAGGEEVFGLPLTDAIVEQKGDDGTALGPNALIVQYFERARFEYYPDKIHEPDFKKYSNIYKYFYIVNFGKLGQELGGEALQNSPSVARQHPDGADYQFFPATGHDLSGAFLRFWQDHYGYKIFGAPLTQPLIENGLQVQYFEGGRLEFHPELANPVQVSKLGIEAAHAKGLANSTPVDFSSGLFLADAFQKTWRYTDAPVAKGAAPRSWLWGPSGFTAAIEPYQEAVGGQRLVQYFDKSRMEISNPTGNADSKWYVTNGLLVKELISGQMQVGDNSYIAKSPAPVAVAGDPTEVNPDAPTYASFTNLATLQPGQNNSADNTGQAVTATLDKIGNVGNLSAADKLATLTANAMYIKDTGHNIPAVFWKYLAQSRGLVDSTGSGNYTLGDPVDWVFSAGLPITEAYWVNTKVGGKTQMVLVQAFERRILTFTPDNSPEFQVEMGNVGRHYYNWRYLTRNKFGP